jgi:predicted PP-loop superfamily ATPase
MINQSTFCINPECELFKIKSDVRDGDRMIIEQEDGVRREVKRHVYGRIDGRFVLFCGCCHNAIQMASEKAR